MSSYLTTRVGFKWSVNEVLSLQREFELLGWTIEQIAQKHKRTPSAITFKLYQEGFDNHYKINSKLNFEQNKDNDQDNDQDKDNIYNLSQRVNNLEENIYEISGMIKHLLSSYINPPKEIINSWH